MAVTLKGVDDGWSAFQHVKQCPLHMSRKHARANTTLAELRGASGLVPVLLFRQGREEGGYSRPMQSQHTASTPLLKLRPSCVCASNIA